ncbi:hypothetical protein OAE88_00685 [bacterium]|nr:hypothetical protein [bacterium]
MSNLVNNSLESLYNGVNQQSAEYRHPTQVKEMVNAYPTIDRGLLKRNPTSALTLSSTIDYDADMWLHSYDRGLAGGSSEKYIIKITDIGMEIIDIVNGDVFKEGSGLTYDGTSKAYLTPFGGANGYAAVTIKDTTFISNKLVNPLMTATTSPAVSPQEAYVWIEASEPVVGYSYTVKIKYDGGGTASVTTSGITTTEAVATDIATKLTALSGITATTVGSIVQLSNTGTTMVAIETNDSYGDQASFGWVDEVENSADLPKNLNFEGAVVKVSGTNAIGGAFWLKYTNGLWRESIAPSLLTEIDGSTMPHKLVRNAGGDFTLSQFGEWSDRLIGDDDTNELPKFMDTDSVIKDVFFFKNRLGFITQTAVCLSETGQYGNFFRTSVAASLDSDPINTDVDTTQAISLEYATYIEDSVMLFSDKIQFRLKGGVILSPSSIEIAQTSAYEMNNTVRPIFINNRLFFSAKRGNYSAIIEYIVSTSSNATSDIDITAHAQTYIPSDIKTISSSPIDNLIFITATSEPRTMFVYKYYDSGEERVQSAWFKWTFNGDIYGAISLGDNINVLISRAISIATENWILGTGIWNNSKLWDNSLAWVMSPASLTTTNQVEQMSITPIEHTENFLDNGDTIVNTLVNFGEWVYSSGGKKDIRSTVKFKTMQISSEEDSDFSIFVTDNARGDTRTIESKYSVGRRPMVYGDTKNVEIGIVNNSEIGFKINTVSYEGAIVSRSRRT